MPLTDKAIKGFKPQARDYKRADSNGLVLLVRPNGSKLWRFRYRVCGREKVLSIGAYPEVSLREARDAQADARKLLRDGVDPSAKKQARKAASILNERGTFEVVAEEWLSKQAHEWSPEHHKKVAARIKRDVLPKLGRRPVAEITASEILAVLQPISDRGKHETTNRACQNIGQIIRFAAITGRAQGDPTPLLKGALPRPTAGHHAAIIEPKPFGDLLRAIEGYEGTFEVGVALRMAPHVALRPGELRRAEWSEIDLVARLWTIPSAKMKMREDHMVPLSRQVVALFEEIRPRTGHGQFVFPSPRSASRPLSNMALLGAIRNLGFDKETATVHGFRASFRTMADEQLRAPAHLIEHQLAHAVKDANGRAYNRTTHLEDRVALMQGWSDYLDVLRDGAKVSPLKRSAK
jgi:integrase